MDLPPNSEVLNLPENRVLAEKRLQWLKQRLLKDPDLKAKYTTFMEDLIRKGHAELAPSTSDIGSTWFLPHQAVTNPNKPGKVRVVFDCSAKFRNICLNDKLFQGPDLNNTLLGVLLRFRRFHVAMMSDVEAMFYQVYVSPQHRDLLRFLWWEGGDITKEPQVYRMTVHIFGAKSSPSCCTFALKRTVSDNDTDELTKTTVLENFYMDDCLVSVPDEPAAMALRENLTSVLAAGGFRLTKWVANSLEVLQSIPKEDQAAGVQSVTIDNRNSLESTVERTLGIRWNLNDDTFVFDNINKILQPRPVTRRTILSTMSSIFDP